MRAAQTKISMKDINNLCKIKQFVKEGNRVRQWRKKRKTDKQMTRESW